jgi:hypothetical protein
MEQNAEDDDDGGEHADQSEQDAQVGSLLASCQVRRYEGCDDLHLFFRPPPEVYALDRAAEGNRRRYVGGAHWSQWGSGRVGVVVTFEQLFRVVNSDRLDSRLLAQTLVEF